MKGKNTEEHTINRKMSLTNIKLLVGKKNSVDFISEHTDKKMHQLQLNKKDAAGI